MNYVDDLERKWLIGQVLEARTLAAIDDATAALRRWVTRHPDDLGIVDGFEALATMRECVEARETDAPMTTAKAEVAA